MEWGCMQALIDFDGWRKWKDFSQTQSTAPVATSGPAAVGGSKVPGHPKNTVTAAASKGSSTGSAIGVTKSPVMAGRREKKQSSSTAGTSTSTGTGSGTGSEMLEEEMEARGGVGTAIVAGA